jgi:hypothetical protein
MKQLIYNLIVIIGFFHSCQTTKVKKLAIEGDLYAKNLVEIKGRFPKNTEQISYRWFISSSINENWEELQGIHTPEIILLADYIGSYLKCEVEYTLDTEESFTEIVVTSSPIEYRGNPDTDWFKDAGWGIMVHYLKPAIVPDGTFKEWNEAVNSFNVERFAEQANHAGAGFVMFTLGQNSGYYCSPNAVYDSIVGVNQGELCSIRDLPMDLMIALEKYNIPLILYLPSNPPNKNRLVDEKFYYPFGKDSATTQFNQALLEKMIQEWSLRYGKGIKGWWFDGLYEWNNIRSARMDMSLKHNISTHTLAAKAGNENSIVTYNYGFGKIQVNTPYCDYSSGEKRTIDEFPESRWVKKGVQWFLFTYLGEKWGGSGQQFETDSLVNMTRRIIENEGVLCLEVVTDSKGEILPNHLNQISAIGRITE